jgi:serine/threonine protein kinase
LSWRYEGETLKERIRGPVPQSDAVSLAIKSGRFGPAHAAGIIHRDIKPANIIVIRDGLVKFSTSDRQAGR